VPFRNARAAPPPLQRAAMLAARPLVPRAPARALRCSAPRRSALRLRAPRAITADADASPSLTRSTVSSLAVTRVDELLAAIAGTDSGASATPDDRRRVLSLAAELEAEYAKTGVRAASRHALMRWSGCV